ncbi:MAG TPA: cyclic pyranopterin monophosphate synthase MoaC [Vitreimonas sp.]|jgi:cyclic pyranopterin phosphate synthase|nr:cyclic pyranopterin monophosphate synthase MoaC [Vitreimonas sp.]
MAERLTHLDEDGRARMVDVGDKLETQRTAVAAGAVSMCKATLDLARAGNTKKGDVRSVSEIAGIMAAKRTADLIPLCHPLPLSDIKVSVETDDALPGFVVTATAKTRGRTGVEMEALTAVSVACLTLYDMLKASDRNMRIENIRLLEKSGGASGDYRRSE